MKALGILPLLASCSFAMTAGPKSKGHSWETCTAHHAYTRVDLLTGSLTAGTATVLATVSQDRPSAPYVIWPLFAAGVAFTLSGLNGKARVEECRAAREEAQAPRNDQ